MSFKRMRVAFFFAFLACSCSSAFANSLAGTDIRGPAQDSPVMEVAAVAPFSDNALPALDNAAPTASTSIALTSVNSISHGVAHLRKMLVDFAITLRDIRYRRGGREPSTGFDCSGFVHYVFSHSVGTNLPSDSASQFRVGAKIARADMKTGDLVFFRTQGKHVSHVGIYLDNGRFIHSPSSGKRVSISSLDDAYWARRFVGAKRPNILS